MSSVQYRGLHDMRLPPDRPWLVFTDLDGTLLDHDTYDWSPAKPALQLLRTLGIPVIPVSSKTSAELEPLCAALELNGSYAAENGSVIVCPGQPAQVLGPGYASIRDMLVFLRDKFEWRFSGFGDMGVAQVSALTGLSPEQAACAMQRKATEPVLWLDTQENMHQFRTELERQGLKTLQGGRFLHILSKGDKGSALEKIATMIHPGAWTIALGDSPNDRDLLLAADCAVIIKRKHQPHLSIPERPDAILTTDTGPAGWNQAIQQLLDEW